MNIYKKKIVNALNEVKQLKEKINDYIKNNKQTNVFPENELK